MKKAKHKLGRAGTWIPKEIISNMQNPQFDVGEEIIIDYEGVVDKLIEDERLTMTEVVCIAAKLKKAKGD